MRGKPLLHIKYSENDKIGKKGQMLAVKMGKLGFYESTLFNFNVAIIFNCGNIKDI